VMGDRGRLVIPVEVREHLALESGTALVLVETAHGLLLVTRDQMKRLVRSELGGAGLVAELLAERRRQAAAEDAA